MKIKTRIALQFTLIVASILVVFSVLIYSVSANFREEEFNERLYSKALTTCRFLVMVSEVDVDLLRIIDKNSQTLIGENVLVFNLKGKIVYSGGDRQILQYDEALLKRVKESGEIQVYQGENQVVGLLYDEGEDPLIVLAAANDVFGHNKLRNLRQTLLWCLAIGIVLTVILSIHFAGAALKPISEINRQVSSITARNLKHRLPESNSYDEIGVLASNFNDVLSKLEQAFEKQRSFVYHASHELRTPLAALKSEIQLAEKRMATEAEAKEVFGNLSGDTDRLISITNSLLAFARSFEDPGEVKMERIRIEDVLFSAKKELRFVNGESAIHIDYENLPEDENHTLVKGNEELLKRVCFNLMDNASKYSNGGAVGVTIKTDEKHCYVSFEDKGIGIPENELSRIFEAFYRGSNATGRNGLGIGLSICQRIIEMHDGRIYASSRLNAGSRFTIQLEHV